MTRLHALVSSLTAACLAASVVACTVKGPTSEPRKAAASARPRPSGAPTGAPVDTVTAAAKPGALAKLMRPASGTTALRGRVTIEATYALGAGGTLISDKGSGVVANNGASVAVGGARLDAASGRLVSNNSGNVLAEGTGNVAAEAAGGRAPILDGGALLAGGALVANNGANLTGKTKFGLAQAAAPGVGTELPAAGMLVSVVSLADYRYVPLGVRPDGSEIFAVYTDVGGAFEVHVPEANRRNLLVVASVPGVPDRRLNPNVVVASGTDALTVDELERLTTQYLRLVFTQQMGIAIQNPDLALAFVATENYLDGALDDPSSSRGTVAAMLRKLGDLGREAGLPAEPDPKRLEAACRRVVDAIIARVDLPGSVITRADIPMWVEGGSARAPMPVMTGLRQILRTLLDGAGARLRTDPGAYAQTYLAQKINASTEAQPMAPIGDWTGKITTPGDVAEFMLIEYAGAVRLNANVGYRRLYTDFHAALGVAEPVQAGNESANVLQASGYGVVLALARVLLNDPAAAAEVRTILAEEAR